MFKNLPLPDSSTDPKYQYIREFNDKAKAFYNDYLTNKGYDYLVRNGMSKFNSLAIEAMVAFAIQEKNNAVNAHTEEICEKFTNQIFWGGTEFNVDRIKKILYDQHD